MLVTQRLLKEGKETISSLVKKYQLNINAYRYKNGEKYILKYSMYNSDFKSQVVKECRGLVLDNNFDVLSTTFYKFFNNGEENAAKIDWNTGKVFEKLDGSCISLYWCWLSESWMVQTTGMGEAEGEVDVNKFTFSDLFWKTFNIHSNVNLLPSKDYIYTFELMTPDNIIITPHKDYTLKLLTVRNRSVNWVTPKMGEFEYNDVLKISNEIGIDTAKRYNINTLNSIESFLTKKDKNFEGVVVLDGNFNRLKIKNKSYVIEHYLSCLVDGGLRGNVSSGRLLKIVIAGQSDDIYGRLMDSEYAFKLKDVEKRYLDTQSKIDKYVNKKVSEITELFGDADLLSNRKKLFGIICNMDFEKNKKVFVIQRILNSKKASDIFSELPYKKIKDLVFEQ